MKDQRLLSKMDEECWDVRTLPPSSDQTGCFGDVVWAVVSHYQAEPFERIVAYGTSPREAITNAMSHPLNLEHDKCQTFPT
jgi:hypothetical protein